MILSDKQLTDACTQEEGGICIEPFDKDRIQPASYDLRVGKQAAVSSKKACVDLAERGFLEIEPGDFVIVTTHEKLSLDPRHVGRFGLTSSFARKGLIATAGPQVDPGFKGRLLVGLTNLSGRPIVLSHKAEFLTIEFHRLEQAVATPYKGDYQGREELTQDDIVAVMEREYMSQTEMMRTLETLVTTVNALEKTVSWRLPMTMAIILTVIMTIFGVCFSLFIMFLMK